MSKTRYMHMIDSRPAGFDGDQICVGWREIPLCDSLAQIRREQRLTIEFRTRRFGETSYSDYDYVRVRV